jgi:hypothetical protein
VEQIIDTNAGTAPKALSSIRLGQKKLFGGKRSSLFFGSIDGDKKVLKYRLLMGK